MSQVATFGINLRPDEVSFHDDSALCGQALTYGNWRRRICGFGSRGNRRRLGDIISIGLAGVFADALCCCRLGRCSSIESRAVLVRFVFKPGLPQQQQHHAQRAKQDQSLKIHLAQLAARFGPIFVRDRVIASGMPWVATAKPAKCQPQASQRTAFFDCLNGITGA